MFVHACKILIHVHMTIRVYVQIVFNVLYWKGKTTKLCTWNLHARLHVHAHGVQHAVDQEHYYGKLISSPEISSTCCWEGPGRQKREWPWRCRYWWRKPLSHVWTERWDRLVWARPLLVRSFQISCSDWSLCSPRAENGHKNFVSYT